MGDPFYSKKLNALFHEFEEIGCNQRLGYKDALDLAEKYPQFYWTKVEPFLADALDYLSMTVEGRLWTANLYSNVFEMEHGIRRIGPGGSTEPQCSQSSMSKSSALATVFMREHLIWVRLQARGFLSFVARAL